jgi:hypothetical protein
MTATTGPLKRIDHIILRSSDPAKLFSFFSDQLKFPFLWPMTDFGDFTSGALYLGNTVLEIMKGKKNYDGAPHAIGLALEAWDLDTALEQLQERGIEFPEPSISIGVLANGKKGILFTSVPIPSVRSEEFSQSFIIDWSPGRKEELRILIEKSGKISSHPLSVCALTEVMTVIPKSEVEKIAPAWQRLMDPIIATSAGVWDLCGIKFGLLPLESNNKNSITLQTNSIQKSTTFLTSIGVETKNITADKIQLQASQLQGLDLFLTTGSAAQPEINPYSKT